MWGHTSCQRARSHLCSAPRIASRSTGTREPGPGPGARPHAASRSCRAPARQPGAPEGLPRTCPRSAGTALRSAASPSGGPRAGSAEPADSSAAGPGRRCPRQQRSARGRRSGRGAAPVPKGQSGGQRQAPAAAPAVRGRGGSAAPLRRPRLAARAVPPACGSPAA